MEEKRFIDLLIEFHSGVHRLGPGNEPSTHRALFLCKTLPASPEILNIGCGTAVQTLILASGTNGSIIATDRSLMAYTR